MAKPRWAEVLGKAGSQARAALLASAGLGLALGSGCHSLRLLPLPAEKLDKVERPEKEPLPSVPGKRSFREPPQFIFLSDFEIQRDLPLFRDLGQLRGEVYEQLSLSPSNTLIHIYLFDDRDRYERFMKSRYPDLPRRRAFFVAQPHNVGGAEDLLVYTYWGDRIQEDLRHELTHALLHSVLRDVPLWLDEGLAEYFELPAERQ